MLYQVQGPEATAERARHGQLQAPADGAEEEDVCGRRQIQQIGEPGAGEGRDGDGIGRRGRRRLGAQEGVQTDGLAGAAKFHRGGRERRGQGKQPAGTAAVAIPSVAQIPGANRIQSCCT